jgi:hypothetical protein
MLQQVYSVAIMGKILALTAVVSVLTFSVLGGVASGQRTDVAEAPVAVAPGQAEDAERFARQVRPERLDVGIAAMEEINLSDRARDEALPYLRELHKTIVRLHEEIRTGKIKLDEAVAHIQQHQNQFDANVDRKLTAEDQAQFDQRREQIRRLLELMRDDLPRLQQAAEKLGLPDAGKERLLKIIETANQQMTQRGQSDRGAVMRIGVPAHREIRSMLTPEQYQIWLSVAAAPLTPPAP